MPWVDHGKTVNDYQQYRETLPREFLDRLVRAGVLRKGMRALDLATGTGVVARRLASCGCRVVGLDLSPQMLVCARKTGRPDGSSGRLCYVRGRAEAIGFSDASFDLAMAGHSWVWFESRKAFQEVRRVLRPGGHLVIFDLSWIAIPGNLAELTEKLILQHNPDWPFSKSDGFATYRVSEALEEGYSDLETFSFDVKIPFSHEQWRGRIRASAGIGGSLSRGQVQAFDNALARLLERHFPEPRVPVLHRLFAIIAKTGEEEEIGGETWVAAAS